MKIIKLSLLILLLNSCSTIKFPNTTNKIEGIFVHIGDLKSPDYRIGATEFTFKKDGTFSRRDYCCLKSLDDEDYQQLNHHEIKGNYYGLSGNRLVLLRLENGKPVDRSYEIRLKADQIRIISADGKRVKGLKLKKP